MAGHGRRAVNPHREQGEPGEELHHGELLHHAGHVEEVLDDLVEPIVRAPGLLHLPGDDLQHAERDAAHSQDVKLFVEAAHGNPCQQGGTRHDPRQAAVAVLRRGARLGLFKGLRLFLARLEGGDLLGRVFLARKHRPAHGGEEHDAAEVE